MVHGFLAFRVGPGLIKGGWRSKRLKKRRVLYGFSGKAVVHDRAHGTIILQMLSNAKFAAGCL